MKKGVANVIKPPQFVTKKRILFKPPILEQRKPNFNKIFVLGKAKGLPAKWVFVGVHFVKHKAKRY